MIPCIFIIYTLILLVIIKELLSTRKKLKTSELYNKSLETLYNNVQGFKHDFNNIISTLDGYIKSNDITGLKNYFNNVKKDCEISNNLSTLNPNIINDPGIFSLINSKYFKATDSGVSFYIEVLSDLSTMKINKYKFSRILGILLDNAIEEAEKCEEKNVRLLFIREDKNNRNLVVVENTYSNKNVDVEKIFSKGISGKKGHSGIGLWEVKNYISKSKNLDLFTSKNNEFFRQELAIYD